MYVALEGVDTCGKSTQIELLKTYYPHAIFTKEPGGSVLGEYIREIILSESQPRGFVLDSYAECFLFLADRAQHYTEVLLPNKNKLIISDRSVISGIAYARDMQMQQSVMLNAHALRDYFPDLVVILELDEIHLRDRLAQKTSDNIENRGIAYMLEIQSRLFEAVKYIGVPYAVINANKSKEDICQIIREAIDKHRDSFGL